MDKVQLVVLGLSASPASNSAYALILKEVDGNRRLPIIIGAFEAQAIALEMEGVVPPRPMTHDLLKNLIDSFDSNLTEVYVNELREGTFYAKLIFDEGEFEIDARPSDAIALAVRFNAPIFVKGDILDETGLIPQGEEPGIDGGEEDAYLRNQSQVDKHRPKTKAELLQTQLEKAVKDENYEKAALLRDELRKILESS
ncbi:MAG: bifunctional nuclease family protein [Ignavibacteriae bacterium]|nr:bifunctional nuclease family protein [Ignavibacteriota bacterium]